MHPAVAGFKSDYNTMRLSRPLPLHAAAYLRATPNP